MDLIAGLNELIAQMEVDVAEAKESGASGVGLLVSFYVRTLKTLIKAASSQPAQQSSDGGVSVNIGGSQQPQQPAPPQRPFKANRKLVDPWEEARRKAADHQQQAAQDEDFED